MFKNLFGKQCGPRSDCSCSGSTLFASILNSSVMLGIHSQQTTSADDIFKCILRVNRRVDKLTPRVQSDHRSGYSNDSRYSNDCSLGGCLIRTHTVCNMGHWTNLSRVSPDQTATNGAI